MATGIVVDFSANLARFTGAIDKATNDLNKFQSNASRVSKNIGSAFAGLGVGISVVGIAAFGKATLDAADSLNDMSLRTGVAVKDLASLKTAAEQNGTTLDSVARSLQRLTLSFGKAQGGSAPMEDALKRLGVTSNDSRERLFQLSDAYVKSGGSARTLADIQAVLGKSYTEILPLLSQGADELRKSAAASESFAESMARLAPDADRFNDQLSIMKNNMSGLAANIVSAVVPSINEMIGEFTEGTKIAGGFFEAILLFGTVNPFKTTGENVTGLRKEIESLEESRVRYEKSNGDTSSIDTSISALKKKYDFLKYIQREEALALGKGFEDYKISKQAPLPGIPVADENAEKKEAKRLEALKKIQDDLLKSNKEYVKSLQDKALTFSLTEKQAALYELSQKNITGAQREAATAAIESTAAQKEQAEVTKTWAEAVIEANKEIDDDKTAKANAYADAISRAFPERGEGKQYAEDVAAINQHLAAGIITAEEAQAAIDGLGVKFGEARDASKTFAEEFNDTWADASRSFSDNFGRATADAILESTSAMDALRASARSFGREVLAALISIAARKVIDFALSKTMLTGSTAANIAAGTATALAWAPAAAAVSLASFGGNSLPAAAGISSTYALTSGLALLGMAHDGLESVPKTGTYLLEGGERVVKKEDNKRLEKFLSGENTTGGINITFNVVGRDAPRASEIVASQRGQIISIIQGAYDNRLARGGPVR